ncbi:MAG: toll/interleukin-1 receptor domain-containing protein [Verrucomicrobiia bacterium]|jgi:hypothetical protein
MANPEHLAILQQGVEAWNRWRDENPGIAPDLSGTDLNRANLIGANLYYADLSLAKLSRADLHGANLSRAKLSRADLHGANLSRANLSSANLSDADLSLANLGYANLSGADLSGANLIGTNLSGTNLKRANLSGAHTWYTNISYTDLSDVIGLDNVDHKGPSSIGIDTLYKSQRKIPDAFLRGAGVPEGLITYAHSLVNKPFDFYSCFISYSEQDREFADRLYRDLQGEDVRCWLFSEDAKWGETVWGEIDRTIKLYDKLVVACSENSLQSPAVLREIERGLQREDREKKNVLFPIRIDDYIFDKWEHERKADVVKKVVGDFRKWKNHHAYQKSLVKLLQDLHATDSKKV